MRSEVERAKQLFIRGMRGVLWLSLMWLTIWTGACSCEGDQGAPTDPPIELIETRTITPVTPNWTEPAIRPTTTVGPTASITPTAECLDISSQLLELSYPGVVVEQEIPVKIFLPPCYSSNDQSYPVTFLLHGFPFDETQWQELGVFDLAEMAMLAGRWPPAVLVVPKQPAPIFTQSDGGPNSYEREFLEGVLPLIEEVARVSEDVHDRSIAGISRGGVWALEIALRNPSSFSRVAAVSRTRWVPRLTR